MKIQNPRIYLSYLQKGVRKSKTGSPRPLFDELKDR